jgi:hypothetical protein
MDEPGPNGAESPKPVRRNPRPVVRPAQQSHNTLAVGLVIFVAAGGGLFVLAKVGMRSTAGARVSTRLEWERRDAELDRIISKAEADGKLRKPDERR